MRFKALSLPRYGAFAGRELAFGEGNPDLHLIVGPNEGGKSTLLSAISDLLFGFGHKTAYDFRWSAGELRVAATLEHNGQTLELVRRKGRGDTLSTPAGAVVPESALAALLGGVDREAFTRTFGLNHGTLRQGGQEILEGKDDAARVVLEASSGLTGLGELVAQLEAQADDLFAPRASTKLVNVALREREEAQHVARSQAVTEREWVALVEAREAAEGAQAALVQRGEEVGRRQSHLERVQRTRSIIAKIDRRREELEPLASLPRLPDDAEQRHSEAATALVAERAARDGLTGELTRITGELSGLPLRDGLLDHAATLQSLIEQRPVHLARLETLPQLIAERETIFANQRRHLSDAGLSLDLPLPPKIERRKAHDAIEAAADSASELKRLREELDRKKSERQTAQESLAGLATTDGLEHLRIVLDMAPRNGGQQIATAHAEVADAERAVAAAFLELKPWTGSPDDLREARVLPADDVAQFRQRFITIEAARKDAADDREAAISRRDRATNEMKLLVSDGKLLPTPAAVQLARASRDQAVDALENALTSGEGRGTHSVTVSDVRERIRDADAIVDRRTAEATRLAEYATQEAEVARQSLLITQADARLATAEADLAECTALWLGLCQSAGFQAAISPAEMAAWTAARERTLAAIGAREEAISQRDLTLAAIKAHVETVRAAVTGLGRPVGEELDPDGVVRVGLAVHASLVQVQSDRTRLSDRIGSLDNEISESTRQILALETANEQNASARSQALVAIGLSESIDDTTALAALDALDSVAADEPQRADLDRRIGELQRQIGGFEEQARAAFAAAEQTSDRPIAEVLLKLSSALVSADKVEQERARLQDEETRLTAEVRAIDERIGLAEAELAQLAATAGAADDSELAETIARVRKRDALEQDLSELADELNEAGGGEGEGTLRSHVVEIGFDDANAELAALQAERTDLDRRLIEAAEATSAARRAEREASTGSEAAEALQMAEEAGATAIEAAERYASLKTASAVLQWAVSRYRAARQAPLLARAGEIMARVTGGALARLEIEYEGDDAHIVGIRPSDERVNVDGMSEGTLDQLYLSLRLASIEDRVASHPVPFVCDDLLMTADDARAGLILQQLAELARRTQVICFTHHRHLVEVATTALGEGGVVVHHIEAVAPAAG